jgi:hypothetical protein
MTLGVVSELISCEHLRPCAAFAGASAGRQSAALCFFLVVGWVTLKAVLRPSAR